MFSEEMGANVAGSLRATQVDSAPILRGLPRGSSFIDIFYFFLRHFLQTVLILYQ